MNRNTVVDQQEDEYQRKNTTAKQIIEHILHINIPYENLCPALGDGRILCKLMNSFHQPADYIHFSDNEPLPKFKRNENIHLFLKKCRLYVSEDYLFNANDLLDGTNMESVLDCLFQLFDYFEQEIKQIFQDQLFNNTNNNNNSSYIYDDYNQSNNNNNNYQQQYGYQDHQQQQHQQQFNGDYYYNNHVDGSGNQSNNNTTRVIMKKGLNGYILDALLETKTATAASAHNVLTKADSIIKDLKIYMAPAAQSLYNMLCNIIKGK
ncbi:hypothetical protein DFA_05423 [Cavenderia fasciculata]|uniref:Calponin-homology (CH) domain-containing protein n=1 Tax=Cavenderia fasciculata TaxID=261658 RepID=F4PL69_CACFS|nr:uncharacterized protein DFA_05423 [Cavenderia fasciculata]EGG23291.1 hypothetical protein DFA_05423 [Cavenderia fasciculata]|eukprot:XP_004361142.1 hypothetical protein DFA_05423 [Cavenderia fasciculata]